MRVSGALQVGVAAVDRAFFHRDSIVDMIAGIAVGRFSSWIKRSRMSYTGWRVKANSLRWDDGSAGCAV